jgi:hypothetical protein
MTPQRIQLRRTKGWRKPPDAVTVSRPTRWGNPITVAQLRHDLGPAADGLTDADLRALAVDCFAEYLEADDGLRQEVRDHLAGHDLACWCPLDGPCHADVLLRVANEVTP